MIRRKLYLHIGTGKTGTTALQSFCKINNALLNKQGYHYLRSVLYGDNSHHILGFALWGAGDLHLPGIPSYPLDKVLQDIRNELEALPEAIHTVIISSELLYELAAAGKAGPLIDFIKEAFHDIKVVCYLRRQDHHIESLYRQWIKTRHEKVKTTTIEDFAQTYAGDMYHERLKTWSNLVDKSNVIVRVYEKRQFTGGSIFTDFFSVIGARIENEFKQPSADRSNLSINPLGIQLMRRFPGMDFSTLEKVGFKVTEGRDSKTTIMTAGMRKAILDRHQETNAIVAREYLGKADGVLFLEAEPGEDANYHAIGSLSDDRIFEELFGLLSSTNLENTRLNKRMKEISDEVELVREMRYQYSVFTRIFELDDYNLKDITFKNDIDSVEWTGEGLRVVSIGNDPFLVFQIPASGWNCYRIRMQIQTEFPIQCQFFYKKPGDSGFTEKNSRKFELSAMDPSLVFDLKGEQFDNTFRIDLGTAPGEIRLVSFSIEGRRV